MKNLLFAGFLLSLSGIAVEAVSFRNNSDVDADILVSGSNVDNNVKKGMTIPLPSLDFSDLEWRAEGQRATIRCPNPHHYKTTDNITVVLKGVAGNYTCHIE